MTTLTADPVEITVGSPGAWITADQTITIGTATSGAVAWGLTVDDGTTPTDLTAKVYRRAAPNTLVVELDQSFDRTWQDQLNETGSGSLKILNDDPDYSSIQMGDVIRYELQGFAAFSMLARDWQIDTLVQGEEADELTTIQGPGIVSVLDEAVVYPSLGVGVSPITEDRVFNWTSPEFDASDWHTARFLAYYDDQSAGPFWVDNGDGRSLPKGFPADAYAVWVGPTVGDANTAPPGDCYYIVDVTFTDPGRVIVYFAGDDLGRMWFDSTLLIENRFGQSTGAELDVSAGLHRLAIWVQNAPDQQDDNTGDPTGFVYAIYEKDGGTVGTLLAASDASVTKVLEYPPFTPGMTPGQAVRLCVEEAQARGALPGVDLNFDDHVDSAGVAWPIVGDIATKVGNDVLTFCRELSGTYIDFWMEPASLTLWLWNKDTRGGSLPVTLDGTTSAATSNVATLTHRRVI